MRPPYTIKAIRIIMPAFLEVQLSINDIGSLIIEQATEEERDIPDMIAIPSELVARFVGHICQVTGVYPAKERT